MKKIAEERYSKPAKVIPNFVDTENFRPAESKEDLILYAGRLHWSKGVEYLIKAYGLLKKDFPSTRLLICGGGDQRRSLALTVQENDIPDVEFMGVVDQEKLAHLMGLTKAFVLPTTTYEGHPKALIEAMAYGTACIATDVPGNRDVIGHMTNGLLVAPKDISSLYQALLLLHTDERLLKRLARNAYLFAVEHYSIKKTLLMEVQTISYWTQENFHF